MHARIYVNPRCSKCRTALSILEQQGMEAEEIRYLDTSPSVEDLEGLARMLGVEDPRAMMRTSEPEYQALGLADASRDELLRAIAAHPILLERPIFAMGGKAVIARPPERLLELLCARPAPGPSPR